MGGTALGGCISLAACNNGGGDPAHNWDMLSYGRDEVNHWRECTDEGCDLIYQVTPHDFSNGNCICGQPKPGSTTPGDTPGITPGEDVKEGLVSITAYDHTQNGSRVTLRLQKLFKVGDKFNTTNLVVEATSKVDGQDKVETLAASDYEVVEPDMSTAGEKTVVIKYGGKETSYTVNVIDLSGVSKNEATVTVDKTAAMGANGNVVTVKSINDAVQVFKLLGTDDNTTKTINVTAGTYHEKVEFDIPNLHVVGATSTAADTVIEFDLLAAYICPGAGAAYSTDGSATVSVRAGAIGFHAENITFQNYYNTHERYLQSKEIADKLDGNTMAVACLVQGDKCVFDNVRFSSYHDTLYDYNGRHVYNNCFIEGRTDYVFGYGATSLYNNCTLNTIGADDNKNGGYVCATRGFVKHVNDWTTANTVIDYGYIFKGCTFTADGRVKDGTVSLARAWSGHMTLAFIECSMTKAYSKTAFGTKTDGKNERYGGGMKQGDPNPERLYEYGNTGEGALDYAALGTGVKESLCTILTEAQKNNLLDKSVIFAAVNGQYEYSSAWNGEAGAVIPATYNFSDLGPQASSWSNATTATPLFDGAMTILGEYKPNGNSVQVKAGTVIQITDPGKIVVDWWGGTLGTAANGKIIYKNGHATLTIVADSVSSNIYIKSITVDSTQEGVHVHEYGEWNITKTPSTTEQGTATRTCRDCELATAHVDSKVLPVLSTENYNISVSQNAGKSIFTLKTDTTISFEADALAGVHVHHYGAWEVKEANKPKNDATGLVTRTCTDGDCNHDSTATESKELPKLDDARYKITNNTATLTATGTGTYTITIDGITDPVSFTEATPKLPAEVTYDLQTVESGSVSGTLATPASLFDGAMTMVGGMRFQKSTGAQLNKGTIITLTVKGAVEIEWYGGGYGSAADGKVTYKDGYATIEIIGEGDWNEKYNKYNGAYIKTIKLNRVNIPADTKYTVTFNSNGGSTVESAQVIAYGKVTKPADPTRDGYTFNKWHKDETCLQEFDFETDTITSDTTLYAKWKSNSVNNYTVTLDVWGESEGTVSVEEGTVLTAETVDTYLAAKGYKNCHAELYTDAGLTTPLTEAITADGTVYVKVVYDVAATIDLLEYDGEKIQGAVGYWRGIKIDAVNEAGSGTDKKFCPPSSSWCQFNTDTTLSFYVKVGTTATITELNGTHKFEVDKDTGLATITSGGGYIRNFTLVVPVIFKVGDSVDFVNDGCKLRVENGAQGEFNGVKVTAPASGGFYEQTTYMRVDAGTTFSFNVADGITTENLKILLVDHNGSETNYYNNGSSKYYTVVVENGIATVTTGSDRLYVTVIKIAAKA